MSEEPICKECEQPYLLHDGFQATEYCDPCAQKVVIRLERELEALRADKLRLDHLDKCSSNVPSIAGMGEAKYWTFYGAPEQNLRQAIDEDMGMAATLAQSST